MKHTLLLILAAALGLCAPAQTYTTTTVEAPFPMPAIREYVFPARDFPITAYGATTQADSAAIDTNTRAIAAAIAACHAAGGGRVVVPEGTWATGPVHLRSGVCLHLAEGAVLAFDDTPQRYLPAVFTTWEGMECYNYSPLVYAYDCDNVAITGPGTLAPRMQTWRQWFARPEAHCRAMQQLYAWASTDEPVERRQMAVGENHMRPQLIQMNRCRGVRLEGFHIRESPFWTIHLYMCDGGVARGLDVHAHGHNNDGIDLEMTRNFLVERCTFDQGDDAVVIKAGRNRDAWRLARPAENIVVRDCRVLAGHVLLGIGSEISGGVRNVYMTRCQAGKVFRMLFVKTNHRRGAFIEHIYMDSVRCHSAQRVLEIDTDVLYQWKDLVPTYETRITRIEGIHISRAQCDEADAVYELKGDARLPVRDVSITDVSVGRVGQFRSRVSHVEGVREQGVRVGAPR